jgi:Kef-type K+ transport system membrane component KefB
VSTSRSSSVRGVGVYAAGLAAVVGIMYATVWMTGGVRGPGTFVASVGFLLLAGTLTSRVIEILGVPHLTGYLVAGIIAGPHVLHLIDHASVTRLQPVNTLALALIAFAGGAEIKLETVRRSLKSLAIAMTLQSVAVLAAVGGVFYLVAPTLIPFTRTLTPSGVLGVALLWGVLAVSRSPSATLAVLAETRARGPLTSFSLAFVMSSDVVVVLLLAAASAIARPLIDPSAHVSLVAFAALGHEILGSTALGTTLGLVLAAYLRLVGRQLLVVLVALGFGATETLRYLHFDPLLAFLVAGFVVQNLSAQGDKLLHAVEGTSAVVYVVFFATAGAHLDLALLGDLWQVSLLLAGSRALVTVLAARGASRLAGDPPLIRRWGWAPLISQAGLTLGLSAVIARDFPAFGAGFRALAIATVAINELVGPILFKRSLDGAKESKAPRSALAEPEELPT